MIKIEIPEFDLTVNYDELDKIPRDVGGVYILFTDENQPLYVGISKNLSERLQLHFLGCSNTSRYKGRFHTASMFYEPDELNRRIYEMYLINKLNCPANIANKDFVMDNKINNSTRCAFVKNNGEQCKHYAHTNGYCRFHGGNGISRGKLIQDALKDALSTYESSLKR